MGSIGSYQWNHVDVNIMAISEVLGMWLVREILAFIQSVMNRNNPTMEEKHASNSTKVSIAAINQSNIIE